jgi:hypothetical protein
MRMTKLFSVAVVLLGWAMLSASPLRADGTDTYTYQANGNTFTWQLPVNPTPSASSQGFDFTFTNFTMTENGSSVVGTLDFYTNAWGGALDFFTNSSVLIDAFGLQLFNGSVGSPTMLGGTYWVIDFGGNDNNPNNPVYIGELQVASVPEPSTLLLLLVGTVTALGIGALRKS